MGYRSDENSEISISEKSDTLVRDRLARQRTELANERTLLSYIRTALGFFIVGIPAVWWMEGAGIQALGVVSLVMGLIFLGSVFGDSSTSKRQSIANRISREETRGEKLGMADRLSSKTVARFLGASFHGAIYINSVQN